MTIEQIGKHTIDAAIQALVEGQSEKALLVLREGKAKMRNVETMRVTRRAR